MLCAVLCAVLCAACPSPGQVGDAQQDGEPAVRPAAGVLLPGVRHVPEAPEQAGGGHGEAHPPHGPPEAGEEGRDAEGTTDPPCGRGQRDVRTSLPCCVYS